MFYFYSCFFISYYDKNGHRGTPVREKKGDSKLRGNFVNRIVGFPNKFSKYPYLWDILNWMSPFRIAYSKYVPSKLSHKLGYKMDLLHKLNTSL
jgi:hypothetical protein